MPGKPLEGAGVEPSVTLLCAVCIFICYCDRVNISVAVTQMAEDFQWDKIDLGWVLGSFYYGYVTSQILGSYLASKFGGRRVLGIATLVWSTLTCLTPWAAHSSMVTLVTCRILLGLTEGMAFPCVFHILGESHPERRSRNIGMVNTGSFAGTVVAFLISSWLIEHSTWPVVFWSFGSLGFFWFILWYKYALTDEHGKIKTEMSKNQTPTMTMATFMEMIRYTPIIAIYVAHFCHSWAHFTVLAWLPTYVHDTSDESEAANHSNHGMFLVIPYILMVIVTHVGAKVSDSLIINGWERVQVRKMMECVGFGTAGGMMIIFMQLPPGRLADMAICISLGFTGAATCGHEANKLEVVPPEFTGLLQGISNTFAAFSGVVAVPVAANLYVWTKDWKSIFTLITCIWLFGMLFFYKFASSQQQFGSGPRSPVVQKA